jgi:biopolymer transport protein ExbB
MVVEGVGDRFAGDRPTPYNSAMSILEIFKAGGPVMWPLAICSVVTVAIIIERALELRTSRILDPSVVERVTGLVEGGRLDRAMEVCRKNPGIFTHIVAAGLHQAPKGEPFAREAVEDAGRHETIRLTRYLPTLGTVAAVSPLLGLLGTVTGMIAVFKTIANSGIGQAAELANGISQALITTATGLLIAIPALVAYNYYSERAERIINRLEGASLRVLRSLFQVPLQAPVEVDSTLASESASRAE